MNPNLPAHASLDGRQLPARQHGQQLHAAHLGVVGLLAALCASQPLLIPFAVLAYVPVWVATIRNSRTSHGFDVCDQRDPGEPPENARSYSRSLPARETT